MVEQPTQFGRVPADTSRGLFSRCPGYAVDRLLSDDFSDCALRVYLYLVQLADWKTWITPPVTHAKIAHRVRRHANSVSRAIKELRSGGLLEVVTEGGHRGTAPVFRIPEKPTMECGQSSENSPPPTVAKPTMDGEKAHRGVWEKPTVDGGPLKNREFREFKAAAAEPGRPDAAAANDQIEVEQGTPADTPANIETQALAMLIRASIGQPTAGDLAARAARLGPQSLAAMRREIDRSRGSGKGPGAIVLNLRAALDDLEQRPAQSSQGPTQDYRTLAERLIGLAQEDPGMNHDSSATAAPLKAHREEDQPSVATTGCSSLDVLRNAEPEQLAEAKRRTLAKFPGKFSRQWKGLDPADERCDPGFRLKVAQELRAVKGNAGAVVRAADAITQPRPSD